MSGESWKSHKNTTRERDAHTDHHNQLADIHPYGTAGAPASEWTVYDPDLGIIRDCTTAELHRTTRIIQQ